MHRRNATWNWLKSRQLEWPKPTFSGHLARNCSDNNLTSSARVQCTVLTQSRPTNRCIGNCQAVEHVEYPTKNCANSNLKWIPSESINNNARNHSPIPKFNSLAAQLIFIYDTFYCSLLLQVIFSYFCINQQQCSWILNF